MRCLRHSALIVAALVAPAVARGDPTEGVAFEWLREPGADACADRDDLAGRVAARLGRAAFVERETADTIVSGLVVRSRRSPRWRATLALTHAGEARDDREITSDAPSCRPLEDAVVLFLGLLLEAQAPAPGSREPPSSPLELPAVPSRAIEAATVVQPTSAPAPSAPRAATSTKVRAASVVRPSRAVTGRWNLGVAVGPVASLGLLPALAGGLRVAAHAWSPWRVGLQIAAVALGAQDLVRGTGRTTFSAQLGGIGICPTILGGDEVSAGLCGGLQAGWIRFDATGYTENRRGSQGFGEAFAGTWLSVQVWRWLRAGASAGVTLSFWRWPFEVGEREVHRMALLGAAAEVHAAVRLP